MPKIVHPIPVRVGNTPPVRDDDIRPYEDERNYDLTNRSCDIAYDNYGTPPEPRRMSNHDRDGNQSDSSFIDDVARLLD